ncbi:hypothetical protein GFD17_09225 [Bifidobacterium sp. SMB2]|uniref:Uncharacterized protein n=1 Tax=Bifidobacterium saimiriisciurei TaxID=2661627 RepID=A0ABX0C8S2_9BIFI|nr:MULTISPECIES: hypothetical protein [Bifidobacterium]NEG96928.1 hypothetical protein [Bifidobacterium sp. SMB2]NEH11542.1 hypothetical protein [Bifidobacterium saimiriisciurei]
MSDDATKTSTDADGFSTLGYYYAFDADAEIDDMNLEAVICADQPSKELNGVAVSVRVNDEVKASEGQRRVLETLAMLINQQLPHDDDPVVVARYAISICEEPPQDAVVLCRFSAKREEQGDRIVTQLKAGRNQAVDERVLAGGRRVIHYLTDFLDQLEVVAAKKRGSEE